MAVTVRTLQNFDGGEWVDSPATVSGRRRWRILSPADGSALDAYLTGATAGTVVSLASNRLRVLG